MMSLGILRLLCLPLVSNHLPMTVDLVPEHPG